MNSQNKINHEKPYGENSRPIRKLVDSHWLAKRLDISYEKARVMGRRNEVPVIRVGKLIRYSPEAIEQWLNEKTLNPRVSK